MSKSQPLIFTMYSLELNCFLRSKFWTREDTFGLYLHTQMLIIIPTNSFYLLLYMDLFLMPCKCANYNMDVTFKFHVCFPHKLRMKRKVYIPSLHFYFPSFLSPPQSKIMQKLINTLKLNTDVN